MAIAAIPSNSKSFLHSVVEKVQEHPKKIFGTTASVSAIALAVFAGLVLASNPAGWAIACAAVLGIVTVLSSGMLIKSAISKKPEPAPPVLLPKSEWTKTRILKTAALTVAVGAAIGGTMWYYQINPIEYAKKGIEFIKNMIITPSPPPPPPPQEPSLLWKIASQTASALWNVTTTLTGTGLNIAWKTAKVAYHTFSFLSPIVGPPVMALYYLTSGAYQIISNSISLAYSTISAIGSVLGEVLAAPGAAMLEVGSGAASLAGTALKGVFYDAPIAILRGVWNGTTYFVSEMANGVTSAVSDVATEVWGAVSPILTTAWDYITYPFIRITQLPGEIYAAVLQKITNIWETVTAPFIWIYNAPGRAYTAAADAISYIWGTVTAPFVWIYNLPGRLMGTSTVATAANQVATAANQVAGASNQAATQGGPSIFSQIASLPGAGVRFVASLPGKAIGFALRLPINIVKWLLDHPPPVDPNMIEVDVMEDPFIGPQMPVFNPAL